MMQQRLSPGLQNSDKADAGPQLFFVAGDGRQTLGGGPKQKAAENPLVFCEIEKESARDSDITPQLSRQVDALLDAAV